MRYAAFDRRGIWLFDFISDVDDVKQALREAQEEDPEVSRVIPEGDYDPPKVA